MAGDWIPMRTDLLDSPQVVRIAYALCTHDVRNMSERCRIIGALYRTWSLVDQYCDDGILDGYTAETLDQAVGIEGWAEQLQAVGWLKILPQSLEIPGFDEWFGSSAKRRLKESKRQRKRRAACTQNVRIDADGMRTRGEERRVENIEPRREAPPGGDESPPKRKRRKQSSWDPTAANLPPSLGSSFRETWLAWCQHRVEIKKPLTPKSVELQLQRLAGWGPERAVKAIEYTISQGWEGIREPEANGRQVSKQRANGQKDSTLWNM